MKVKPIGNKLLIKEKEVSKYFPGTNIVKTTINKEHIAHVIAVGDAVSHINIGDTVKYSENANLIPMKHDNEDHFIISNDMIFAILSDE
jgi:co-chaperonin GroES (HSP10)